MVPNVSRGYSFKKLSDYLTHDKPDPALAAAPRPQTAERIGFTKLINFHEGEARTVDQAAKVMALMVRDADKIKRAAGVKLTGGKAKAPPVYHLMLSWAKHEQVDEAEMMRAGAEALEKAGLGLDKGYLTCAVSHTDTEFQHIHFEVCLVHPETGKQANPHDDQIKLQKWAREYDRKRGQQHLCPDREAKYAALDRARTSRATRAAFNDNARGMTAGGPAPASAKTDQFGRSRERVRQPRKGLSHTEWQARKTAGNDNPAAQQAADRIKANTAAKWAALRSGQAAAFERRNVEASRFYADRKAGREAIYQKYETALDGVWNRQGGPKQARPDLSPLAARVRQRQEAFEANEKTALGRIRNALTLAEGSSLFRTARLALNAGERRQLFERGQRAFSASIAPRDPSPSRRNTPKTPSPKRVQAERLKAMRSAELAQYGRETMTGGEAMKARHSVEIATEKDASAALSKEIKTAWRQHNATHARKPEGQPEQAPATPEAEKVTRSAKPDRFGRSRDRQPRTPRAERAENSPVDLSPEARLGAQGEAGYLAGQFHAPETQEATHAQPEATQQHEAGHEPAPSKDGGQQSTPSWTKEERQARIDAEHERQARLQEERGRGSNDNDTGRTMEP